MARSRLAQAPPSLAISRAVSVLVVAIRPPAKATPITATKSVLATPGDAMPARASDRADDACVWTAAR